MSETNYEFIQGNTNVSMGGKKKDSRSVFKKQRYLQFHSGSNGIPDQHNLETMGFQENNILINFQLDIEASNLRDALVLQKWMLD